MPSRTRARPGRCSRGRTSVHSASFAKLYRHTVFEYSVCAGSPPGTAPVMATRTLGGRYRLVRRIGRGGMSEVWHGHDAVLDRPVAVKVIAPGHDVTAELVQGEARSAARLAHPNVAAVHDFGTCADQPYIVMELVEGRTLGEHLRAGP